MADSILERARAATIIIHGVSLVFDMAEEIRPHDRNFRRTDEVHVRCPIPSFLDYTICIKLYTRFLETLN